MERFNPARNYESFSIPYLKRRLELYEDLKVKLLRFTAASFVASSTASWSTTAFSDNPRLEAAGVAVFLGGFMVSIIGAINAARTNAESNRIISAAKPKGAKVEGYVRRRIIE